MSCVDLPQIIVKQSFLAQSGSLSPTTIYTPASSALFRISGYLVGSAGMSGSPQVSVKYTDDLQAQDVILDLDFSHGIYGHLEGIGVFRGTSSNVIQVYTTFGGSGTYDLYIVLEQLW